MLKTIERSSKLHRAFSPHFCAGLLCPALCPPREFSRCDNPDHTNTTRLHTHGTMRAFLNSRRMLATASPPRLRRLWPKAAGAVVVSGTALYLFNDNFHDGARHACLTVKRVSVITWATLRCFKIYKDALGVDYSDDALRKKAMSHAHLLAASITLKALEYSGGIYIKLGQHISALTYLLPAEWTDTMTPLQDKCPQSSREDIQEMFRRDMGVEIDAFFSEFDWQPVGIASLAQVHIATLRDTGEKVAVKMQHPLLAEFVPLDIRLIETVYELITRVFPEYPMTWLSDELRSSIFVELDFENEAQNAQNTGAKFAYLYGITALKVPEVIRSEKRILIMEYVAGKRLDDLQYMRDHNIDPAAVSACLAHIFNYMIFVPNVGLHCDPHLGNLAIRKVERSVGRHNFEIILYDHGLYRYIPLQMKRDYSHFWLALLDKDIPKVREYARKFAGVEGDLNFRVFLGAITGRDPSSAMNYDITKARDEIEILAIQNLFKNSSVLETLVDILSNMPRTVLLILKTNDLTRNLDECLGNSLGPERTFLIMASYCARDVYEESLEVNNRIRRRYSWTWFVHMVSSWMSYHKRLSSLYLFDLFVFFRNLRQSSP